MELKYFAYDVYQEQYYCKKCDKNHRFNSNIGRKHREFGVHPFGIPNMVITFIKEAVWNGPIQRDLFDWKTNGRDLP